MEGKVKFFNTTKGFGFIQPSDGSTDVFVHVSDIIDQINENDKVSFEIKPDKKGPKAVEVRVIESASDAMAA